VKFIGVSLQLLNLVLEPVVETHRRGRWRGVLRRWAVSLRFLNGTTNTRRPVVGAGLVGYDDLVGEGAFLSARTLHGSTKLSDLVT